MSTFLYCDLNSVSNQKHSYQSNKNKTCRFGNLTNHRTGNEDCVFIIQGWNIHRTSVLIIIYFLSYESPAYFESFPTYISESLCNNLDKSNNTKPNLHAWFFISRALNRHVTHLSIHYRFSLCPSWLGGISNTYSHARFPGGFVLYNLISLKINEDRASRNVAPVKVIP